MTEHQTMQEQRRQRGDVWRNTLEELQKIHAGDPERKLRETAVQKEIFSSSVDERINNVRLWGSSSPSLPVLEVSSENCIEMMIRYHAQAGDTEGPLMAVLNLASPFAPAAACPGAMPDGTTQEEELFRCTSLSQSLHRDLYPWKRDAVYYSPHVTVMRSGSGNSWQWLPLEQRFAVAVISAAAPCRPQLMRQKRQPEQLTWKHSHEAQYMNDLIHNIFRVAMQNGHRTLILGALGCGVFENPTAEVAAMFASEIAFFSRSFGFFDRIAFAIYGDSPKDRSLRAVFLDALRLNKTT